jgi:hypothetical protein
MKYIKDNLTGLLVLVLLLTLFIERCNKPVEPTPPPKIVRDTVWVKHDSVVYSKPQLVETIQMSSKDSLIYVPDTNYSKLVLQYQEVVNQLLIKNIQVDSVRIDTNGYVKIVDTVQKNLIVGRSTQVSVKYPVVKETITLYPKPVNQVYIGGDVEGSQTSLINQVRTGVILKNKKDQIFTASVGLNTDGQPVFGLGSYWKIKLKK